MKIYIIGPLGSGKTTLSNELSLKYNIECYELDSLVYDDENNHQKRSDDEIEKLFNNIINKDSWIIEDIGRTRFTKGLILADKIYYLKINKFILKFRILKRWLRQRMGKEKYNYPPTFNQLIDMYKVSKDYFKKEKSKLEKLKKYKDKVIFLKRKDLGGI